MQGTASFCCGTRLKSLMLQRTLCPKPDAFMTAALGSKPYLRWKHGYVRTRLRKHKTQDAMLMLIRMVLGVVAPQALAVIIAAVAASVLMQMEEILHHSIYV